MTLSRKKARQEDAAGADALGLAASSASLPTVVIVGRPNVGKSSLFNRMAQDRVAVVADEAGTTRDRVSAIVTRDDRSMMLIDTGGIVASPERGLAKAVRAQVETAIAEADILLFIVDASAGIVPADEEVAAIARTSGVPVLLVANKADTLARERFALEFHRFGLGEPLPVSAHHNLGVDELWDRLLALLPRVNEEAAAPSDVIAVAIVGRPNVGKSSLVNALLGEERVVVDAVPGTTRDAIDTLLVYNEKKYLLIDTAGMRRRGHIQPGVEEFSISRTVRAIERADVIVLVVDATELMTAQDLHVAGYIQQAFKGLVVAVNKWDLVKEEDVDRRALEASIRERLKFFPGMPVLFTSALEGEGVFDLLKAVDGVRLERSKRVSTGALNRMLMEALAAHPPPSARQRRLQIYYATQAEIDPPTFVFFTNDPTLVHFSYRRYLENTLRKSFGFHGTAIRLIFKGRKEQPQRVQRHGRRPASKREAIS